jgi:hypothetical protein
LVIKNILENKLLPYLENVPLETKVCTWIHDRVSPHFGREFMQHFNKNNQGR